MENSEVAREGGGGGGGGDGKYSSEVDGGIGRQS